MPSQVSSLIILKDIWFLINHSLRSKRFCVSSLRKLGREQKKGMTGEGEGKVGNACPQTPQFWKTAFAHERCFWLVRCCQRWLNSNQYINQTRYVCLRASQIWSDLICGRRLQMLWSDIFLNHVCAKVYQIWVPSIKSIIGDRVVETSESQFIGNDGVRIWLEKMDCLLEITLT